MQFIYIKTCVIVFIVRFATSFSMYSNFCNINSKKRGCKKSPLIEKSL